MSKKAEIRNKSSREANDPELNRLTTLVNTNRGRKKRAVPKKGFAYFHYENKSYFGALVDFCAPNNLQKTKQYKQTGSLYFFTPSGTRTVNPGNYVVKLNEETYVVFDETAFKEMFSIKWQLVE